MKEKHFISKENTSVRMYQNNFLESLTHMHPLTPHVLFLPVIIFMGYLSYQNHILFSGMWLNFFILGLLFWTITEYLLHRFLFHMTPKKEWTKKIHYTLHGIHHDYPQDATRLVMPPTVSIPLSILFFVGLREIVGPIYIDPFYSGFILGYIFYDSIHYAVHHLKIEGKLAMALKSRHMNHHFVDPQHNFGVSSPFWDHIFRTIKS